MELPTHCETSVDLHTPSTAYNGPASPWGNLIIESLYAKLRGEFLNLEQPETPFEAQG